MASHVVFRGLSVAGVDVFGQTVDAWFEPVDAELRRRTQIAAGDIATPDLLRALSCLPDGVPVDRYDLQAEVLLALDDLVDRAAVEVHERKVTRCAREPVRLVGIEKRARAWSEVQAVTLLRTHAPRLLVVPRRLRQRVLDDIEADVGLAVERVGSIDLVRRPGGRWLRASWQRWMIAEQVLAAWRGRP